MKLYRVPNQLVMLLVLLALLSACGAGGATVEPTAEPPTPIAEATLEPAPTTDDTAAVAEPLPVVATYSILGDMVQNVGGDLIDLTVLVGAGSDPHVYEPVPADNVTLSRAALIFENGLEFETWLDRLYTASGSKATRVDVSKGIDLIRLEDHDHDHEHEHDADHEHEHDADHSHDEEKASVTHRLMVADAESGQVWVIDVARGEVIESFNVEAPATLYTSADGRYAFAVQRQANRVNVIDSGVFKESHGDHAHYRARTPRMLDTAFEGGGPAHFVVHGQQIAVFYDDDGTAVVYNMRDMTGTNPTAITLTTERPHHGVAVPFDDVFLVSIPDLEAEEDGELALGIAVKDAEGNTLAEFTNCPELHGEAVHGASALFACADGILVIDRNGDEFSTRKLDYPPTTDAEARAWRLMAHPDQPYVFGGFQSETLIRIDPATGEVTPIAVPGEIHRFVLDTMSGSRLVALTTDGNLHLIEPESGEVLGSVAAVTAFSLEGGRIPRPEVTAGSNVAYVSDPATGEVIEVLLDDMTVSRSFTLEGKPGRLALAGLLNQPVLLQPADDHDHDHDDDHDHDHGHGHTHGEYDPHIWHSVANARIMVQNITAALVAADPDNAATYEANATAYLSELDELEAFIRQEVAKLPPERRKLVTTHDTFGYFARDYGFEVVGTALGITTEAADPAAGEIAALVAEIQAAGVPAIFAENIANPRLMEMVAREAGVELGPTLFTDALGEPGSGGETYIDMMRYNVTTIVAALQG